MILTSWSLVSSVARAELDDLSVATLEHATRLEKVRGLRLERQLETVRLPRAKVRSAASETPGELDPRPGLAADLPLYRRLGLVPWGADGEKAVSQVTWPLIPGEFFATPEGGRIALMREAPRKQADAVHRIVVGLALLSHHHKLEPGTSERDQLIAASALRLGDAVQSWISSASPSQKREVADRVSRASGRLDEVLTEPYPGQAQEFLHRFVRALYHDGLAAVVGIRAATPWGGVDELYRRGLPRSTAQLLHPARLLEDATIRQIKAAPLSALAQRGEAAVGLLGELRTRIWLEQWLEPAVAARAAAGWSGDRYALYPGTSEDRPDTSTVVLLTTFHSLDEPGEDEARDFAGALDAALAKRFSGELRPLEGQPADVSGWVAQDGLALLVERRDEKVLYIEGCPPEILPVVREQVWDGWEVERPSLSALGVPDSGPAPPIAPMAPLAPWYRRTPGIVALALWLLIVLPLASYLGSRASLSPVKIYLYGVLATLLVIGLGWILDL